MIEIAYSREKGILKNMPQKVQETIEETLQILDSEYVDKIVCNNGEVYTNSLIICNNDYAISIIIPIELTPQNLKDYMID